MASQLLEPETLRQRIAEEAQQMLRNTGKVEIHFATDILLSLSQVIVFL
jgi:hypothetical protein